MALVDPRLLESLAPPKAPPSLPVKALSKLDEDLKNIIDRRDVDESEKVKLYNHILQRYVTYHDKVNQPVKVEIFRQSTPPPESQEETNISKPDEDIVDTVPVSMRHKAQLLLQNIRKNTNVTWDERGHVFIKGKPVESSNITDLLNDVLRRRKRSEPVGWREFANELRNANVPRELIGNEDRWTSMHTSNPVRTSPIQSQKSKKRSNPIQGIKKKNRRKVISVPRWMVY